MTAEKAGIRMPSKQLLTTRLCPVLLRSVADPHSQRPQTTPACLVPIFKSSSRTYTYQYTKAHTHSTFCKKRYEKSPTPHGPVPLSSSQAGRRTIKSINGCQSHPQTT